MVAAKPFFQVAVGLIPTLLLGGLVAERFRRPTASEPEHEPSGRTTAASALALLAFFVLPTLAEPLAIFGAVGGNPGDFSVWVVASTLVFGTYALAAAVVEPWVRPPVSFARQHWSLHSRRQKVELIGGGVVTAAVVLANAVACVVLLHSAVDLARAQHDLARTKVALNRDLARNRRTSAALRSATPTGEWATFVRRIDATEQLVTLQQRIYRVPRPITDEALQALAGLRLEALLGSGNVPPAAEQLLTESTLLFDKTVARAKRKQRA